MDFVLHSSTPHDFAGIPGSTAQHIELLYEKISRLEKAWLEACVQFVAETGRLYRERKLTGGDLIDRYSWLKAQYQKANRSGWTKPWRDQELPDPHSLARSWKWIVPECGYWEDSYPSPGQYPMATNVVYLLFDGSGQVIYVGSTGQLSVRLRTHWRDGKEFTRWQAWYCPTRAAAYELEDRMLKSHMPSLNTKQGA